MRLYSHRYQLNVQFKVLNVSRIRVFKLETELCYLDFFSTCQTATHASNMWYVNIGFQFFRLAVLFVAE